MGNLTLVPNLWFYTRLLILFAFFFVGAVLKDSIFEESANEVTLFGDCKQWSVLEWYNLDNCVWFCGDVTF